MDVSSTKKQIRRRCRELSELVDVVLGRAPLFPGSFYEHKSRCGKPTCKCAKGKYRHRLWCVSFLEEGTSRTRVVPHAARSKVRQMTKDYRTFRATRRRMNELFAEIIQDVATLEEFRTSKGKERWVEVMGGAKSKR